MRLILKSKMWEKPYTFEGLSTEPKACYMPSKEGLPMVFILDHHNENHTPVYIQAESVLSLEFLNDVGEKFV